jgi:hypothetical protein
MSDLDVVNNTMKELTDKVLTALSRQASTDTKVDKMSKDLAKVIRKLKPNGKTKEVAEDEDDEDEKKPEKLFSIANIISYAVDSRRERLYRVHWKDTDSSEDTWEYRTSFSNEESKKLVQLFDDIIDKNKIGPCREYKKRGRVFTNSKTSSAKARFEHDDYDPYTLVEIFNLPKKVAAEKKKESPDIHKRRRTMHAPSPEYASEESEDEFPATQRPRDALGNIPSPGVIQLNK